MLPHKATASALHQPLPIAAEAVVLVDVATADFNGDGKADVVVSNQGSNNIGVLLNQGNGTFAAADTYGSGGNGTVAVATADFNGDGKADVVDVRYGNPNNQVSVCHDGNTLCIDKTSVPDHLNYGDYLGACKTSYKKLKAADEPVSTQLSL